MITHQLIHLHPEVTRKTFVVQTHLDQVRLLLTLHCLLFSRTLQKYSFLSAPSPPLSLFLLVLLRMDIFEQPFLKIDLVLTIFRLAHIIVKQFRAESKNISQQTLQHLILIFRLLSITTKQLDTVITQQQVLEFLVSPLPILHVVLLLNQSQILFHLSLHINSKSIVLQQLLKRTSLPLSCQQAVLFVNYKLLQMNLLYLALNLLQCSEFGLQVRCQKVQLRTYLLNSLNWQFGNCRLVIVIIIVQKCFVKK